MVSYHIGDMSETDLATTEDILPIYSSLKKASIYTVYIVQSDTMTLYKGFTHQLTSDMLQASKIYVYS